MLEARLLQLTPYLFIFGILGLLCALWLFCRIKRYPNGNASMLEVSKVIDSGAMIFLKREYTSITIFALIISLILYKLFSIYTGIAFIMGACCSMLAGYLGIKAATCSAVRSAQAAKQSGISQALSLAFQGGGVMGISVAALGVTGVGLIYAFTQNPAIITGFAMGASCVALFARVGGGIYTKSADIGADLVGKVEVGIPEDDARNPGTIADNVGDNVGDTAGMGADLFESYVGAVIASMALGATLNPTLNYVALPLLLMTTGLIGSVIVVFLIKSFKSLNAKLALNYSIYIGNALFLVSAFFMIKILIGEVHLFWAVLSGLLAGILIGLESEYFTAGPPIKTLAKTAQSGSAPMIIMGLAFGFQSTILPLLTICGSIFVSYELAGLYGITLSAVGMLGNIGIIMTTDAYGPIADNAGGIVEMSKAGESVRKVTDELDAYGNTSAAVGKGFAVGSAALTSLAFFSAYQKTAGLEKINLTEVNTVIGLFLGACMPFLIAASTLKAVGRTANRMVTEIRRQFREIKGLMQGRAKPDSDRCVDIVTKSALKAMILPSIVAMVMPIFIGFLMGAEALGGFLVGAMISGVLLAIFMANSGASWDNAKKWIEVGHLEGKGSDAHAAAIIGDTVGDPLKDTAGPSMNILIKLMAVISLIFAPLIL